MVLKLAKASNFDQKFIQEVMLKRIRPKNHHFKVPRASRKRNRCRKGSQKGTPREAKAEPKWRTVTSQRVSKYGLYPKGPPSVSDGLWRAPLEVIWDTKARIFSCKRCFKYNIFGEKSGGMVPKKRPAFRLAFKHFRLSSRFKGAHGCSNDQGPSRVSHSHFAVPNAWRKKKRYVVLLPF